jgi:hypothetical protein
MPASAGIFVSSATFDLKMQALLHFRAGRWHSGGASTTPHRKMKTEIKPTLLLVGLLAVLGGCATYADPYYEHSRPHREYEYREYRAYPSYPAEPVYRRDRYRDEDRDGIPDSRDKDRDGDGIRNKYDSRPDDARHTRADRDRDHDGMPDRYDKDVDGDGIRNKRDARPVDPRSRPNEDDVDGDGVRNKYDDHPRDPTRR